MRLKNKVKLLYYNYFKVINSCQFLIKLYFKENFVNSLPPILNDKLSKKYPILAKAVAASQILDLFIRDGKLVTDLETDFESVEQVSQDFSYAFDLFDEDKV